MINLVLAVNIIKVTGHHALLHIFNTWHASWNTACFITSKMGNHENLLWKSIEGRNPLSPLSAWKHFFRKCFILVITPFKKLWEGYSYLLKGQATVSFWSGGTLIQTAVLSHLTSNQTCEDNIIIIRKFHLTEGGSHRPHWHLPFLFFVELYLHLCPNCNSFWCLETMIVY